MSEVSSACSLTMNLEIGWRDVLSACLHPGALEIGRRRIENELVDASMSFDPTSIDRDQRRHR